MLGKQPEDGLAFDQGGGRIVTVTRDGWRYNEPLNGQELLELPHRDHPQEPAEGGSLRELRELLNVSAENWGQLVPWAVAALIPNIARPVLLPTGEQGSGKSITARMLASLLDHGALSIGPLPTDNDEWDAMADRSRVIAIDEVTHVSDWLADAMCRAVTGDVLVERELYTEMAAEEPLERWHRCVIASGSIAPDELPADLLDRTVVVQLQQMEDPARVGHVEGVRRGPPADPRRSPRHAGRCPERTAHGQGKGRPRRAPSSPPGRLRLDRCRGRGAIWPVHGRAVAARMYTAGSRATRSRSWALPTTRPGVGQNQQAGSASAFNARQKCALFGSLRCHRGAGAALPHQGRAVGALRVDVRSGGGGDVECRSGGGRVSVGTEEGDRIGADFRDHDTRPFAVQVLLARGEQRGGDPLAAAFGPDRDAVDESELGVCRGPVGARARQLKEEPTMVEPNSATLGFSRPDRPVVQLASPAAT